MSQEFQGKADTVILDKKQPDEQGIFAVETEVRVFLILTGIVTKKNLCMANGFVNLTVEGRNQTA